MTIALQDAIERAELMAGEGGELKQESYNMISRSLEEKDIYPFTIALVERNINVRTGNIRAKDEDMDSMTDILYEDDEDYVVDDDEDSDDIVEKIARAAQTFKQKSPGGLWVPEEYAEEDDIPVYVQTDEGEEELVEDISDEDIEWEGTPEEYNEFEDVQKIRKELEEAGIYVDKDGMVSFFKSNVPGLYTTQIPMKPMPLDNAFKYYEQSVNSVDREQTRVNDLLDLLSRLTSATYDIQFALEDLGKFKYSPDSRSKDVQNIAEGLDNVKSDINSGDWGKSQESLDDLKGLLDYYTEEQQSKYKQSVDVMGILDKLMDIKEFEPNKFKHIYKDLGAVPKITQKEEVTKAARRYAMALQDVMFFDVDSSNVQSFGYDEGERDLYVRFLAKATYPSTLYVYHMVEPDIFDQFFAAPSKGKFVWKYLRDRYDYERLE